MLSGENFPLENSLLYKEMQLEKLEIERLKWLLSEEAGHDVGWDRAYWVWIMRFRSSWIKSIRQSGIRSQGSS